LRPKNTQGVEEEHPLKQGLKPITVTGAALGDFG